MESCIFFFISAIKKKHVVIRGDEFNGACVTEKKSSEVAIVAISSRSSEVRFLERFVEMENGVDSLEHLLSGLLERGIDSRNGGQDSLARMRFLQSFKDN